MSPLVSIVIASYNKSRYISETIQSVLLQTYTNWELLVIDDCSTDLTPTLIKNNFKDPRIFLIENTKNLGANYCRNLGIKISKGEYVLFLDADDLLAPDCLAKRTEIANKNIASNLIVFTMGVFYKNMNDDKRVWTPVSKSPLRDFLQHKLPWSILQPLWKRGFLIKLEGFDESFQRLQDVDLNTRALLHKEINYTLINSDPDCYYRIDEGRKNFNAFDFMSRQINSSIHFCEKFVVIVPENCRSYLLGTVYQTYQMLLNQLKLAAISQEEFKLLESGLFNTAKKISPNYFKHFLFTVSKIYNMYCIRIPGVNKLIKTLLVL